MVLTTSRCSLKTAAGHQTLVFNSQPLAIGYQLQQIILLWNWFNKDRLKMDVWKSEAMNSVGAAALPSRCLAVRWDIAMSAAQTHRDVCCCTDTSLAPLTRRYISTKSQFEPPKNYNFLKHWHILSVMQRLPYLHLHHHYDHILHLSSFIFVLSSFPSFSSPCVSSSSIIIIIIIITSVITNIQSS